MFSPCCVTLEWSREQTCLIPLERRLSFSHLLQHCDLNSASLLCIILLSKNIYNNSLA